MRRIIFSIAILATVSFILMGCEQNKYAYPPYKGGEQNSAQVNGDQQANTQNDQQRPSVFSVDDTQGDSSASDSNNADNDYSLPVVQPDNQTSDNNANTYTIQRGDTLWSIAKKQLGDGHKWKEIVDANPGINPHKLAVGQKIVIPSE